MLMFKFPKQLLFYVNDTLTQTKSNGDYELDDQLFRFITIELSKDKKGSELGKEEYYQYLLDHSLLEKETVVPPHGNSGRLAVPKTLVGKHVRYWIAILPPVINNETKQNYK